MTDITTSRRQSRFLKKVPKPFTTFDYKIFKPRDMKIIREMFNFYNEFQYYSYRLSNWSFK